MHHTYKFLAPCCTEVFQYPELLFLLILEFYIVLEIIFPSNETLIFSCLHTSTIRFKLLYCQASFVPLSTFLSGCASTTFPSSETNPVVKNYLQNNIKF